MGQRDGVMTWRGYRKKYGRGGMICRRDTGFQRYLAYSSVDFDNRTGMKQIEYEQTPPPGIYIREIETGKTAYIYWDPYQNPEEDYFEYRDFLWIEKESFEEYMGVKDHEM